MASAAFHMLPWLVGAAKGLREAKGRKQVHIAASADMDQSSIYRFEQAKSWPRDTDRIIEAYASDLDVEPLEIWEDALRRWREALEQPTESYELDRDALARARAAIPRPAEDRSRTPPSRRAGGQGARP